MISNKSKIVTIFICALIFSACTKNNQPKQMIDQQINNQQEEQGLKGKFSFKNLLSQGKNFSCTYKFSDQKNETETTGKSYIFGKKMYQEIETINSQNDSISTKGFVLSDGEYIYTWSPEKSSGMKIKIEDQNLEDEKVKTDVAGAKEGMEAEYDMECLPWEVDEKVFSLPEGVNFTDFSEMMKNIPRVSN